MRACREIALETLALFFLALLAWLLLVIPARAGWGPSGCAAVAAPALGFQPAFAPAYAPAPPPAFWPATYQNPAPVPQATAPASLAWESDGDGGYALFLGNTQVGWMTKKGVYYPRPSKGVWGKAGEPPIDRPAGSLKPERCCKAGKCDCDPEDCQCGKSKGLCCAGCTCAVVGQAAAPVPSWQTSGVETDKIGRRDKVTLNGHEIDRRRALEVLAKGVPDDSKLPKLTVIGGKADRDRVTKDLETHPALAPFRGKFAVQSYEPGDPMLKGLKFPDGSPSILIQRADRAVIGRNLSGKYAGPEELAQALPGALRRADPDYDPMKDPDLIKPVPVPVPIPVPAPSPSLPDLSKIPPVGWLVGGVGALILILSVTRRPQ